MPKRTDHPRQTRQRINDERIEPTNADNPPTQPIENRQ